MLDKVRTPPIPYVLGGRSAKGTDCINLIGWCMTELGGRAVSRGSNKAWREDMVWTSTLKEAKEQGRLVPGTLLFIDYGGGAMDHCGLYIGDAKAEVIHASSSRAGVYPSTLKNGWTHVAWLKGVEYSVIAGDMPISPVEPGLGQAVVATKDTGLRLRKDASTKGAPVCEMPKGAVVDVLDVSNGWANVRYTAMNGMPHIGWCSADFLRFGQGVT